MSGAFRMGEERAKPRGGTGAAELKRALRGIAEVRAPGEAEEPVLGPAVRGAIFEWLAEINAAEELRAVGLKPRGTALLFGPPGCGKTTLAHHLAARLGIPLVIVGPETLVGSYHGQSEGNVAKLFDVLAASETRCVLLMDEIEAMGGNRGKNTGGAADNARTSTLGVLLRKIEEYTGFAMAATNRPDDLDPALWRRFHMQIAIELPGMDERYAILRRYGAPFAWSDDDIELLAEVTDGASPALLRGLMEGAKRALVLGPKLRRADDGVVAVFSRILTSLRPSPEMATPPLWDAGLGGLDALRALAWPPARG